MTKAAIHLTVVGKQHGHIRQDQLALIIVHLDDQQVQVLDIVQKALDLFVISGLASSRSDARRLVQQGGATINDRKIEDEKTVIDASWLDAEGSLFLRAGKKRVFRILTS